MRRAKFLEDSLRAALDLGLATPVDVLRHATPDVLATQLPRATWARLVQRALDAGRLDEATVIDIVGLGHLCEHLEPSVGWQAVAEIGARALGRTVVPPPPASLGAAAFSRRTQTAPPPVSEPASVEAPAVAMPSKPVARAAPITAGASSRIAGASSRRAAADGRRVTSAPVPPATDFEVVTDVRSEPKVPPTDALSVLETLDAPREPALDLGAASDDDQLVDWAAEVVDSAP